MDFGGDDLVTMGGTSALGNPYTHTGRRLDPETGLYYYRNRYLDSDLGRFISRDPVGLIAGLNLYEYVKSRSTMWGDWSGLGDFAVGARTVMAQGGAGEYRSDRSLGNSLSISHTAIFYNRVKVRDGWAGLPDPKDPDNSLDEKKEYPLSKVNYGKLRWGSKAGRECCNATDADIISCIEGAPTPREKEYTYLCNTCLQHGALVKTCGNSLPDQQRISPPQPPSRRPGHALGCHLRSHIRPRPGPSGFLPRSMPASFR